ncbi:DUF2059 domain-containing protein [Flavobacterium urocaniciphilum]|uniref:DUF2059 domain-containing protein n=1 Tax=Flavobacterium urocaniciphilum TaxID=1299341 RepID=A0A1H8Z7S1_9FLAO|nr:DUF2059 domain-containing protein [Flavobacterium urocaniciphilum]SEP60484.1 hypothetical protein SAMN05444005_101542 [Flavobacterium urocaniciphilum]
MKKIFSIVLIVFSVFTYSQNNTNTKKEKIKQLVVLTGSGNLGVSIADNMIEIFKKNAPNIEDQFWNEFKKEIKPDDLVNLVVPIYDKHFTESEIDDLIKFYNTPVGKKMISKLPEIMQESMEVGQRWGEEIGEKALKKLKEKGLLEE